MVGLTSAAAAATVPVQRIYGTDAIGTSIAVSQAKFPTAGSAQAVVLARSDFFSDALAGGPLAAKVGGPLLITPGASLSSTLDPRVKAEIQRALPVGGTVYILGGDLALSPNIDSTLKGLGYVVVREAGTDEYATAVEIAEQLGNPTTIFEATGLNFPDALSAVPAAIAASGAILLTDGTTQAPETAAYLAERPDDIRYAIGGPLAAAGADPRPMRSTARTSTGPRPRWPAPSSRRRPPSVLPPAQSSPTPSRAGPSWARSPTRARCFSCSRPGHSQPRLPVTCPESPPLSRRGICLADRWRSEPTFSRSSKPRGPVRPNGDRPLHFLNK